MKAAVSPPMNCLSPLRGFTSTAPKKTKLARGLAIAKQIADRHGELVKIASIQGKGKDFIFEFHKINGNQ